jgi:transposase InsO family protein
VRYTFIQGQRASYPVQWLCDALEVSTAGFYAWRDRSPSPQEQRRLALVEEIRAIDGQVKGRYGSPRMHRELCNRGHGCALNTVARLMQEEGIIARTHKKFRPKTTDSDHGLKVADNGLARQFSPTGPNESWVGDITYIPTGEGWLYLAVVEDLYSRMIVGWSMDERMTSQLVVDALEMAVQRRLPDEGLLAHSDRGSQYASEHYQRVLGSHGIVCSMSARACCWDNAPAESFFATLKKELVYLEDLETRGRARAAIFEFIEMFYNRVRLHSTLGYMSPEEFEKSRHS